MLTKLMRTLAAQIAAAGTALIICGLTLAVAEGGSTSDWSTPVNMSNSPDYSLAPVILCDSGQNLHVLWGERSAQQAYVSYRTDQQDVWSEAIDVVSTSNVFRLAAAISPDDTIHVVWTTGHGGSLLYSHAPASLAGNSRSWSAPTTLATRVDSSYGPSSRFIAAGPDGTIHVVYALWSAEALNHDLYYVRSTDNGKNWSAPSLVLTYVTPHKSTLAAAIAIDGRGRVHIGYVAFSYDYGRYSAVGYVRSTDQGATWSTALDLATATTAPGVEMIAPYAFGEDEIHLTWHSPARVHMWSRDGGVTWSQPITVMGLGAAFGGYNQLVKDSSGTLHAVIAERGKVYSAIFDGTKWGEWQSIDLREFDYHSQQLAVCQGNHLFVAYEDHTVNAEIWLAEKVVDAPHVERSVVASKPGGEKPIPSDELRDVHEEATPSASSVTIAQHTEWHLGALESSSTPLWIGVTGACFVCAIAITAKLAGKRR